MFCDYCEDSGNKNETCKRCRQIRHPIFRKVLNYTPCYKDGKLIEGKI